MLYKSRKSGISRLAVLFLFLIFLLVLLGGFVRDFSQRNWRNLGRYTVIDVNDSGVVIKSVDPVTNEGTLLSLPKELQITTVNGRGVWRIEVLGNLADKYGWKWVGDSVSNYLGISYTTLSRNMTLWDRFKWSTLDKSANWESVSLEQLGLINEQVDVDDQKVLGLDSLWVNKVRDLFSASQLEEEESRIYIVNTTLVSGLGSRAAKLIGNSGLRVIMVSTNPELNLDKCELAIGPGTENSNKVLFVQQIYQCDLKINDQFDETEMELRLGREYARYLFGE